ncbi:hypothetical protein PF005_g6323 [Phytophthora fragariae]|uniref:Secreted protein n=1 Tax=Phytophthora fragariae TaxID=53985 RepID=A0A6A3FFP5_9STRA|nr:hypothetical protein PF003_g21550 [Phytophthora fragariae]KAE8943221.1 hypothetical protein PF009_g7040 [Phytophthora fragariae]KAE8981030.1 hypothetical protein PF011_g22195 [Phytophthora fragariae]KAE9079985.1 hypothetical protein PF010_g22555 [Phytophthora fragariae]KAE9124643.1 hypothetical protein PF007_g6623 [Phytophthora fragariae]
MALPSACRWPLWSFVLLPGPFARGVQRGGVTAEERGRASCGVTEEPGGAQRCPGGNVPSRTAARYKLPSCVALGDWTASSEAT